MIRIALRAAAFAALVPAVFAAGADAHVTLEVPTATSGSYYVAKFRVPHGCKGSPTRTVRVTIPAGVVGVKPQPKAGWELTASKGALSEPVDDGHGGKIAEGITEVVWTGKLLDEHFDEFGMQLKLPNRPDTTVFFPVVQECDTGANRWVEIPADGQDPHALKEPAPGLKLTARVRHAAATGVEVADAWARASAGRTTTAGAFMTLRNHTAAGDRLVKAVSPVASRVEVHETVKEGDVMRMREVAAIEVKPGAAVELKPGGLHVMLIDLKAPLKEGERFPVTLTFEKAGAMTVEVVVRAAGAMGGGHAH